MPPKFVSPSHASLRLGWIPVLASALAVWLGTGAIAPPPAGPDGTQPVWTSADSGPGSLRQAIADAAPGDTLYFGGNLSGQTITLSSTLVITKNLTIDGVGLVTPVAISGNNAVRVVLVSNNARVTLANLTLTHGKDSGSFCLNLEPCGGGLKLDAGSVVTLATSTVFSNVAYIGGGIVSRGTLTVLNSTISGNVANSSGGGIANLTPGALYVLNSTFSGNTALNGSAIFNEDALTLLNGTLSGNTSTAAGGGGLRDTSSELVIRNTLIANSTGGDCAKPSGSIVSNVRNLIEDGTCSPALSGDPGLGPLAGNGGSTDTHALAPGSIAIDAGDASACLATDQRGLARPQNETCDIGAYEAPAMSILHLSKNVTPAIGVPYHAVVTYTVVLSNSGSAIAAAARLTDALPSQVDFRGWITNAGASVAGDVIGWNGALASRQAITFAWTATHTGLYNDSVLNAVQAGDGVIERSATATFAVTCATSATVQNTLDNGVGSLRQGLADVCPGAQVDFAPALAGQSIPLTSALTLNKNVTVDGRALATPVVVDGNNAVRILRVMSNVSATLTGLTLAHGRGHPAGALLVDTGSVVTLTNATVLSSTSTSDGGGVYNYGTMLVLSSTFAGNSASIDGGSFYNVGKLTLQGSTFTGNTSNDDGGGLYNRGVLSAQGNTFTRNRSNDDGGGLYVEGAGPALVTNTTFSANTSGYWGGAICTGSSGVITLTNSTLAGNGASVAGGGVRNLGKLSLRNTIIANSGPGADCTNVGTLLSNVNNLVKDGTCSSALSGDPVLGPLADNGGGTLTHALWPASPAIDAASDAADICPAADQRGVTRPQNLHCDIGAVEAPTRLPLLVKSVAPVSDVPLHGVVTYTLLLSNRGSENDPDVWMTDTLPAQVAFGGWVQNAGASRAGATLSWRGAVGTSSAFVFVFTATHTGDFYNETILNTAQVSGTAQASAASAAFSIACTPADTVQNTFDDGVGSLRQALRGVCAGGYIDFAPSLAGQTIGLSDSLVVTKNMTVDGMGLAMPVTLSGNGAVRILKVGGNARVTLAGLALARGNDLGAECSDGSISRSCGGALKIDAGAAVTLTDSTVQSSTAYYGGGVSNFGALLIRASAFAANVAGWDGGGLYNKGSMTVLNSTVSGNNAYYGGGICGVDGVTTLQNSTLSGNTASGGGGGGLRHSGGTLHYSNTLMAGNFTGGDCHVSAASVISTNVNNLVQNGAICNPTFTSDPVLAPLADNGGRTWTHALLAGSAAIDAGGDTCPATDQRGVGRPIGLHCDIGAVEAPLQLPDLSKTVAPTSSAPYHGVVTYTLQLGNGGLLTDPDVWLTDTLPAQVDFGGWITRSGASVAGDTITWHGAVNTSTHYVFVFTATQTAGYVETVVNTARASGNAQSRNASAAFTVECGPRITTQNTQDSGAGSLRQALIEVCAGGLIDFAPGLAGQTIALDTSVIVSKDVSIDGRALATPVTLSGKDAIRILQVTGNARAALAGMTFTRGRSPGTEYGGALKVDAGASLTLTNSTLFSNTAYYGGGLFTSGVVTVLNSTLYSNTAGWAGGGLSAQSPGVLFVQNSTLSGNTGPYGGAIVNEATVIVLNSTMLNNTSNPGNGGGVRSVGSLSLRNTVIAGSGASVDCVKVGGVIVTNTYSLIGDGSATCSASAIGLLTGDPLLGPLAENGGGTRTHAPLGMSPVLNAVWDASCPAFDQRGVARPYGPRCDIGAVEGRPEADVSKSVAPTGPITYHGVVTYTVLARNTGALTDTAVSVSDTLPAKVIFGQWVEKPSGATLISGNRVSWSGVLTAGNVLTVSWTALHIGDYGDIITNTAVISGTTRKDTDSATFSVIVLESGLTERAYLPMALR